MIRIYTLGTAGIAPALHAMRNPKDSWELSDTVMTDHGVVVGDNDTVLSLKLQKAGTEHHKHLRMIMVWADIIAPRYWWTEFDTYRIGVEKISCSTMHRLTARPIRESDFSDDCADSFILHNLVDFMNEMMKKYHDEKDPDLKKQYWRTIIQTLPQSYLQRRTVMMSYAALRNIYRQRKGHKLEEWQQFRKWVEEELPCSWMIIE